MWSGIIIFLVILNAMIVLSMDINYIQEHTGFYRDPLVDEEKVICEALPLPEKDAHEKFYKLTGNLTDPMPYEDVLKFTVWNMRRGFKNRTEENQLNFPENNWRKLILDDLFDMFKTGCNNAYIPHEFLNVIYEMVMIYYNNAKIKVKEDSEKWNKTSQILEDCKSEMPYLALHDISLTIVTVNIADHDILLLPPKEAADYIPEIDLIIDTLWWIFSFSFGSCYYPAGYRSTWAPKYKKMFYEDFIVPLQERWTKPGAAEFGVMIGNFEISHIIQNVRSCVTAVYTKYGIADRQLVRPILNMYGEENIKTGRSLIDDNII